MKEIKEIMLPSLCAALSVISDISVGLLVSHAESFLLSHGKNGNSRNYSYRPLRSSFCSFCGTISISCGKYFCPAGIKEIKEIFIPPSAKHFLLFLPFLWDIIISCGQYFYCPTERTEIFTPHCGAFLSFLPFLRDLYYTMRLAFPRKNIFVPRKERKERKSLLRAAEPFCHFCHFCGTFIIPCGQYFIVPQK